MSASLSVLRRLKGQATAVGGSTDITLQFDTAVGHSLGPTLANKKILLQGVSLYRVSGSATSFQARLFEAAGATNDTIAQRYKSSVTLVANVLQDVDIHSVCRLDSSARLYLRPGPNAGSDNVFDYIVEYEALPSSGED